MSASTPPTVGRGIRLGFLFESTWSENPTAVLERTLPVYRSESTVSQTFQTNREQGLQLTNRSGNLRFHELYVTEGDTPLERRVTFSLRARAHIIRVMEWNNRLFLKNGYHRVYRLHQNGAAYVPALIELVDSYDRIDKDDLLITESIATADRPPVIADFASDAAIDVDRQGYSGSKAKAHRL